VGDDADNDRRRLRPVEGYVGKYLAVGWSQKTGKLKE
jgi:hypothetical protein